MPKKLSVSLKIWAEKIKTNPTLVFWVLLFMLFLLEGWTLNKSAQIVLSSNKGVVDGKINQGVKFNFPEYEKVVKRIEGARGFDPAPVNIHDPFTTDVDLTNQTSR